MPGSGVAYWEEEKKSDKGPDYKGFIVLEMDYKAGEKLKFASGSVLLPKAQPCCLSRKTTGLSARRQKSVTKLSRWFLLTASTSRASLVKTLMTYPSSS